MKKIHIIFTSGILILIATIIFALAALPFAPNYKLTLDKAQTTPGTYAINPQNGLTFSDIELNESLLKVGAPESLQVKLYYKDKIIGEKSVKMDEIRSSKKSTGTYSLFIPFDKLTIDEAEPEHFITARLTGPTDKKEYYSKKIKVILDIQSPGILSAQIQTGGYEIKSGDIYAYSNKNDDLELKLTINEFVAAEYTAKEAIFPSTGTEINMKLLRFGEGETNYEYSYVIKDVAGNETKGKIVRILDTTEPVIKLLSSSSVNIGSSTSRTSPLKFSSNESLSSIKYGNNAGTKVSGKENEYSISGFKIVAGTNTYEVLAIDLAGNESKTTIKVTGTSSGASKPMSYLSLDKCNNADTSYCMQKVGGHPCNNPTAFKQCMSSRCSGAISLTCN